MMVSSDSPPRYFTLSLSARPTRVAVALRASADWKTDTVILLEALSRRWRGRGIASQEGDLAKPCLIWYWRKSASVPRRNVGQSLSDRNLPPRPAVGIGVRRALLALVVAIAASCESGPAPVVTQTPTPGSPSIAPLAGGWVTIRDEDAGFSVSYPATWNRATTTLTPQLSDPHEIFAVGSYPLHPGARAHCVQYPVNAIEDLRPADALVWLAERQAGGSFRPRRGLFLRSDLRATDESPACLQEPKVFFHGITAFEDRGRDFEVYVAWGSDAPVKTTRAALAVLDSLQFDPGPVAAPGPRCGMLNPAGPEYNTVMLPIEAAPGSEVVLSGPTFRGEDGRYFPADRLEVWFNTKVPTSQVPNAEPIAPVRSFALRRSGTWSGARSAPTSRCPTSDQGATRSPSLCSTNGATGGGSLTS